PGAWPHPGQLTAPADSSETALSNTQNRQKPASAFPRAPAAQSGRPSDRSKESARQPHRHTMPRQLLLECPDIGNPEVKDTSRQRRVRLARLEYLCEVFRRTSAAGSNHRNLYRLAD